jgi:hypothetical protein
MQLHQTNNHLCSNENHLLVEYQFQLVQNIYSFLLAYIFNRYWVRFQPALPMLCFNYFLVGLT